MKLISTRPPPWIIVIPLGLIGLVLGFVVLLFVLVPDPQQRPPTCEEQLASGRMVNALLLRDIETLEDSIGNLHARYHRQLGEMWDRVEGGKE